MSRCLPAHVRGHMLLTPLLLALATASLALFWLPAPAGELAREARLARQFALAREALIARAVNDENRPGSLPCPGPDGVAPLLAGLNCPQRLDGLPWSTLKIPAPLDAAHTPLRYLIAPGLQDSESSQPLNSDHPTGLVSLLAAAPEDNIAAVLIAPGPALPGQQRPSANPADYSELVFSQQAGALHFSLPAASNDRLHLIRRHEIMRAVEQRVMRSVLRCLDEHARYSAGELPWAARVDASERQGQTDCTLGRIPATQPGNLSALAQNGADILQQAATENARAAACVRAGNLLATTAQAVAEMLPGITNCLAGTQSPGVFPAAELGALLAKIEDTGLASPGQRQSLQQLQASFGQGADSAELTLQLQAQCSVLHAQLNALLARQAAADALTGACASNPAPLIDALRALSPPGDSSTAARWPVVWGAAACDFLLDEKGWWAKNRWADSVFYHFAPANASPDSWPQVVGHGPVARLVIAAGAARAGQQRPGSALGDYLEGMHAEAASASAAGGRLFSPRLADSNDQIAF